MKKKIGMMVMGVAMLASCTNETGEDVKINDDVIRLGVTKNVTSRATINDMNDLSRVGDQVGIYAVKTQNTNANDLLTDWVAGDALLMDNQKTTAISTTGDITWDGVYLYPKADAEKTNVKFMAYYPYATAGTDEDNNGNRVEAASGSTAPKLHFTLDGSLDVLLATPVTGNRKTPARELTFNHKLTQLSFQLLDDQGLWRHKITNIELIEANSKAAMNLETGALTSWSNPVTLSVENEAIILPDNKEPVTLKKILMLQPEVTKYMMSITFEDVNDGNKPVTKILDITPINEQGGTFKAGKSYVIKVRFSGNVPVQMSAILVPWITGGEGQVVVD